MNFTIFKNNLLIDKPENIMQKKIEKTIKPSVSKTGYISGRLEIDIKEFVLYSFHKSLNYYYERRDECLAEFSEISVHDFRVTVRRLMSFLELMNELYSSEYKDKLISLLSVQMKYFSVLRDTQVQILEIQQLKEKLSHLNIFFFHLLKKEQEHIYKIQQKIPLLISPEFDETIKQYEKELRDVVIPEINDIEQFFLTIDKAYCRCSELISKLNPAKAHTIHELRLAFKKFRYMVEHTRELNLINDQKMKKFKKFQDLMGAVQDSEVLQKRLKKFFNKYDMIPESCVKEILDYFNSDEQSKISKFIDKADGINQLWNVPKKRINPA